MKKRKVVKMLNEYCNNEIPINLNSLRNTMKDNNIKYKLFLVDKTYIEAIYKIYNPMIYEGQFNYEIRFQNLLTIDYFVLVPIDGPRDVNCLVICKSTMKKVLI